MSIELHVHAPAPVPAAAAAIHEQLLTVGWRSAVVRDLEHPEPTDSIDDCVVVGWRDDGADAAVVAGAIDSRDAARLESLFRGGRLGIVALSAEAPHEANDERLEEWVEMDVPPSQLDRLMRSRVRYTCRTGAPRNGLSARLQEDLWAVVGALTGGLCEDPHEGHVLEPAQALAAAARAPRLPG